jgi:anti-sigma B factor antagonist
MGLGVMASLEMTTEEIAAEAIKVVLRGRFDTTGAILIEMPFNALTNEKRAIVVDLSSVNFLSSYGIRVLLVGAKTVKGKGGKLVICCPDGNVAKVLQAAGTDTLIPVHSTQEAAIAALSP